MIKHVEWTRHGLTEPQLTVMIYKKVEDGKVVAGYRIMYYRNTILVVYEDDRLSGGEVVDMATASTYKLAELIDKYYDRGDDLVITGEPRIGEEVLEKVPER
ncbi:hypothetical protein HS1genome_0400 [Sulfodiicoccus acidiphilus]|uniref:Uncharacterized protein n=1 Tax=Sulfodiicoccus acidiphilus TaxID=1670455 RepID=A0A348B1F9_9CREN|nr:hypothetical protein [Sulfodiicoccus acidiphilus]BBD72011.1 hypothetical protein HS1genome_0400 [Sulfodiicoccus acidiphilus]GGT92089.1 hypothetical protein GCM10007116_07380 [Sulfodiicoccus acidiphilus]